MSRRAMLSIAAAVAVIGAGALLVASAISTSSARVSASTEGAGFFAAGTIDLRQADAAVEVLFDADGLYPGLETSGCVVIDYEGSVPATIRLHARRTGGNGLEQFVEAELTLVDQGSCEQLTTVGAATAEVFTGTLTELWAAHGDYASGLPLVADAEPGHRFALYATATVVDDNRAQGLTAEFRFTIEARP